MNELFDIPPCESPRLKWLKKHDVKTLCSGNAEDFDGEPWNAWAGDMGEAISGGEYVTGATEQDAIANWAIRRRVKLWNEE